MALLKAHRHDVTIMWIGQSTVLWQVNGLNILTDPHFGPRASPLAFAGPRRLVPLPVTLDGLPRARTHHGVPADDFVLFRLGETRVLKRVRP